MAPTGEGGRVEPSFSADGRSLAYVTRDGITNYVVAAAVSAPRAGTTIVVAPSGSDSTPNVAGGPEPPPRSPMAPSSRSGVRKRGSKATRLTREIQFNA